MSLLTGPVGFRVRRAPRFHALDLLFPIVPVPFEVPRPHSIPIGVLVRLHASFAPWVQPGGLGVVSMESRDVLLLAAASADLGAVCLPPWDGPGVIGNGLRVATLGASGHNGVSHSATPSQSRVVRVPGASQPPLKPDYYR